MACQDTGSKISATRVGLFVLKEMLSLHSGLCLQKSAPYSWTPLDEENQALIPVAGFFQSKTASCPFIDHPQILRLISLKAWYIPDQVPQYTLSLRLNYRHNMPATYLAKLDVRCDLKTRLGDYNTMEKELPSDDTGNLALQPTITCCYISDYILFDTSTPSCLCGRFQFPRAFVLHLMWVAHMSGHTAHHQLGAGGVYSMAGMAGHGSACRSLS